MHSYLIKIKAIMHDYLTQFPSDHAFLGFLPLQLEANDLNICSRKNFSGHLSASALLLNDKADAAFLIYHKFLDRWLQAGGHLNELEDPVDGAMRELREETGITEVKLHSWHASHKFPIDIDSHLIPRNVNKLELSHFHHDFLYLFESSDSGLSTEPHREALQTEEITDCKWFEFDELRNGTCGKRLSRAISKLETLQKLD